MNQPMDFKRTHESTHVMVTVPDSAWETEDIRREQRQIQSCHPKEGWNRPFEIVLDTGNRVWIQASYMHGLPKGVTQVIDPNGNDKADFHGNLILSIPADWCKFYDPMEAEGISMCLDADEDLLDNAF